MSQGYQIIQSGKSTTFPDVTDLLQSTTENGRLWTCATSLMQMLQLCVCMCVGEVHVEKGN